MATTAERLRTLMAERGLKQADILRLAEEISGPERLTKTDLSQYVSGKVRPGPGKLRLLAKALGVGEAWLLGYEESPEEAGMDGDVRQYLQFVRDNPEYRMMFDLCGSATMEEIKATVAFLKALREQKRDEG
ncbi:MAG: helix-turn-helix domain-containing protein [Oscillospiraceae bacterium]|nr:helix-turn-helix domain-containing protein [Oscillospiraceae bacterium]